MNNTRDMRYLSQLFPQLDAKRGDLYCQFGYKQNPTFPDYYAAYKRHPAAKAAIERHIGKAWGEYPCIKELREGADVADDDQPTPWEKSVADLLRPHWKKLQEADRRKLIGRYSAVILRVADGQDVSQPLGTGKLVDVIPVYESQLRVTAWDSDLNSEAFGLPAAFQYKTALPESHDDTQGQPEEWKDVHPSRVVVYSDGDLRDMFEGIPLLEAGFNRLSDLEKITGGSAESYLKNSSRTIVFEFDKDSGVSDAVKSAYGNDANVADVLEEQARDLNTSTDASVVMQGGKLTTLQVTVADPTGPWTTAANEFAASVQIPFTILFGQQTGRLASDQDQADWAKTAMSRQKNAINPFIEGFIRRLMQCGAIKPMEQFCVEWDDLLAASDSQKLDNAAKMASINESMVKSGESPAFDGNEVRTAGGYAPRSDAEIARMREDSAPADMGAQDGATV